MRGLAWVLAAGACLAAPASAQRATQLRLAGPEGAAAPPVAIGFHRGYAAGICVRFSQPPLANWKKFSHAAQVLSRLAGSIPRGRAAAPGCAAAGVAAAATASATIQVVRRRMARVGRRTGGGGRRAFRWKCRPQRRKLQPAIPADRGGKFRSRTVRPGRVSFHARR